MLRRGVDVPPSAVVAVLVLVIVAVGLFYWMKLRPPSGDLQVSQAEFLKKQQQRMQYREPEYKPNPKATANPYFGGSKLEPRGH